MKIIYKFLFLNFIFFSAFISDTLGQDTELKITGQVTSEDEPMGLPGTNVLIKGTTTGAVTDIEGRYSINVPSSQSILVFSSIGYVSQEVVVGNQSTIDIQLLPDMKSLEEVVVVGYTEQSRMKVTSAVSLLDDEELRNIPSVSPVQALQGKLAGVSIPVLSGQPGGAANIVIRGGTSLRPYGEGAGGRDVGRRDSSDPLVVVDGVFRDFNDINPDDIASIQVMKDAASTAIYGARGANGVIVVRTKTGRGVGKSNFTFRYQHGVETQSRQYDDLNGREYLDLARKTMARGVDIPDVDRFLYITGNSATVPTYTEPGEYGDFKFTPAYMDNLVAVEGQSYVDNLLQQGWETMDDPVNPGNIIIFKDSKYQDVVWQTANTSNYNFRVDGSSEAAHYNLSFGYIEQGGTFIGTGYQRLSALANSGYKVNEKLNLTLNLSYLWNDDKYSDNTVRDFTRGVRVPPLNRLYHDDGRPHIGEGNNPRNRPHQLYYQDFNANTNQFIVRLAADYEIIPNLHYRPSISLNTNNFIQMNFEKYYPEQPRPRDKYQRQDDARQIMTDHILQLDHTIGSDHNIMVLGGFNYTRNTMFRLIGTSQRSATDYISTITGDPQTSIIGGNVNANLSANSLWEESKSASFFGQANYDFDNKYLFAASIRYDGFSNFAPENRFATFPSLSAGWNMSNEDFWNINFINHLKLRSSWGMTGLSNLSIGDTYGIFGASLYATESGVVRNNLPNPRLLWETTESFDIGTDISLFNSRLNIVFDYYNKLTRDRLASLPLAGETGFGSIRYNVGSLRNSGFEVELNANIINLDNFTWNTNFSFAFNRMVIVELPQNNRDKNRINGGVVYDPVSGQEIEVGGYAEGERPGGLWAWKSNGIFATDEEARESGVPVDMGRPAAVLGTPKNGGDVNWADLNGDGLIDGKDLVFMGYRVPDKIGGLQNTFRFKGLTMRFTLDYAMGHVINNGALARAIGQGRSFNEGAPREALGSDTWQNQGDTGMKYPRFSFGDYDIGQRNHLRFIHAIAGYTDVGIGDSYGVDNSIYYSKGDWVALRELSFSYDLPVNLTQKLNLNRVALNAGVYNLGYITAYKGLNPEVYKGFDEGGYPRPRQFTIGATINFN
ncbi:MAG: SusC/RagA family TonB-linked outer membrane protein [Anditalea sp.]